MSVANIFQLSLILHLDLQIETTATWGNPACLIFVHSIRTAQIDVDPWVIKIADSWTWCRLCILGCLTSTKYTFEATYALRVLVVFVTRQILNLNLMLEQGLRTTTACGNRMMRVNVMVIHHTSLIDSLCEICVLHQVVLVCWLRTSNLISGRFSVSSLLQVQAFIHDEWAIQIISCRLRRLFD